MTEIVHMAIKTKTIGIDGLFLKAKSPWRFWFRFLALSIFGSFDFWISHPAFFLPAFPFPNYLFPAFLYPCDFPVIIFE
ncbi:MAG: hypothetical protein EHM14_05005 [Methanothrix sp.]|nr:MAG: hypothetical protein EHM14_05005 [Methanothrix sp.]